MGKRYGDAFVRIVPLSRLMGIAALNPSYIEELDSSVEIPQAKFR